MCTHHADLHDKRAPLPSYDREMLPEVGGTIPVDERLPIPGGPDQVNSESMAPPGRDPQTPPASIFLLTRKEERMGYRRFDDAAGQEWEVRDVSRTAWDLVPVQGNPGKITRVEPPGYEADPFELSVEELQRLLGGGGSAVRAKPSKNPFKDS